VEAFDTVVAIDPKNAEAYSMRALNLKKLGRSKEAEESRQKAAELNPRYG
jgi:Flp pilus assembly protein TadD